MNSQAPVFTDLPQFTLSELPASSTSSGAPPGASIAPSTQRLDTLQELRIGAGATAIHGNKEGFWVGAEDFASAPFSVDMNGNVIATSITISGYIAIGGAANDVNTHATTVNGSMLTTDTVTSAKAKLALRGWSITCAFSVGSANQVNWGAGSIVLSDGTTYSISSGNTGAMAARTYIYLDIGTSVTVLQTTTTAANAIGDGKLLVATAVNNATEATFQVFGGTGGLNIDAANIVAGSITANELAAGSVTAAKISVASLSAINASLGTITAGTITLDTSGFIRGGQTAYNTGSGFFLGYSTAAYKFSIGDGTVGNSLTWDGTTLTVNGSPISNNHIFGNGEDGTVVISSNTSLSRDMFYDTLTINAGFTLTTNGYRIFVKNTLTVQSTAKIAWNGNAGSNGVQGSDSNPSLPGTGGAGGSALSSGAIYGSGAGKTGGSGSSSSTGNNGTAGDAITNSFATSFSSTSGAGGAGGNGSGAGSAGGSSGASGSISASTIRPYNATFAVEMFDKVAGSSPAFLKYNSNVGGAGGGGVGGAGSGLGTTSPGPGGGGGGSGSGGGFVVIAARIIVNNGSIESTGGNGGNGGKGGDSTSLCNSTNAGGGGGGGGGTGGPGGVVAVIYSSLSGSGTITAVGGAGGTGGAGGLKGSSGAGGTGGNNGSAGSNGSTGVAGKVIQLQV